MASKLIEYDCDIMCFKCNKYVPQPRSRNFPLFKFCPYCGEPMGKKKEEKESNMPKCQSCGATLEYTWYTDENGKEHNSIFQDCKYLEMLVCPDCKMIYALEMK